jgi:hypothetical protein
MSSSEGPERRPVIPARQARQAVTGHNVRLVLGFSMAAVVIVNGLFRVSVDHPLRSTSAWRSFLIAPASTALAEFPTSLRYK